MKKNIPNLILVRITIIQCRHKTYNRMESKKMIDALKSIKSKLKEKNIDIDNIKQMIDSKIEEIESEGTSNTFTKFFDTVKSRAGKVAHDIKESVETGAEKAGLISEKSDENGESKFKKAMEKAKHFTADMAEKFSEKAHNVSQKLKKEDDEKKQPPRKAA